MSCAGFQTLCHELCGMAGLPIPLSRGMQAGRGLWFEIAGNPVSVLLLEGDGEARVQCSVEFGAVPSHCEEAVLTALMEVNALMRQDGVVAYAREAVSGHIVLKSVHRLSKVSSRSLHRSLVQMCELARSWREDFFLYEVAMPAAPPEVTQQGMPVPLLRFA